MKKIPEPKIDIGRLGTAINTSRLAMRWYRQERLDVIKQYVGTHWSEESINHTVPVNLLALYSQIMTRNLVSHNPRVMISTFDKSLKPTVATMEAWANEQLKKMKFAATMKRFVMDALLSIGICKVALTTPGDSQAIGWNTPAGQPYVDVVDFDDFVVDIHAQRWEEVTFIGHRVRLPLEAVKASKFYSSARHKLTAEPDKLYNKEGDERVNTFGRTTLSGTDSTEYKEHVYLWEIYLPQERRVVTLADTQLGSQYGGSGDLDEEKPLRVQEWLGPDCGPYHILAFDVVPGNLMPIGKMMQLKDLHMAVNNIFRKLIRQAERYKDVTFVAGADTEDGKRLIDANDGDIISVRDPQSLVNLKSAGPSAELFQLATALNQMFSRQAGNLDAMGGLSPQAKTAAQDQMLSQGSSAGVADMQDETVNCVADIIGALCWYWWHHPTNVMKMNYQVPGVPSLTAIQQVHPNQRARPFTDLQVEIDPYSLRHKTPESAMAAINQVVTQIVIPMQPMLQQQGIFFDVNAFLSKIAKFMNMPDLNEILSIAEPPQAAGMGNAGEPQSQNQQAPAQPAQTTRTYVRQNMPGRTQEGDMLDNVNRMMGANKGGADNKPKPGAWG